MDYRVVFDVSQNGSQLIVWTFPLLFTLLSGAIGWALKKSGESPLAIKGIFLMIVAGCALLGSIAMFASSYSDFRLAKSALERGDYQVVEGTVTDFIPMPPAGHALEGFRVGDVSFKYSSGWGSTIFNADFNSGFIHDGAQVRITSVKGNILRVETK